MLGWWWGVEGLLIEERLGRCLGKWEEVGGGRLERVGWVRDVGGGGCDSGAGDVEWGVGGMDVGGEGALFPCRVEYRYFLLPV